MMRSLFTKAVTIAAFLVFAAIPCLAVDSYNSGWVRDVASGPLMVYHVTITANSASANFSPFTTPIIEGLIAKAEVSPGGTAPTNAYDVTVTDSNSYTVFGEILTNCSSGQTVWSLPYLLGDYRRIEVNSPLTISVTGNAVNSAVCTFRLYWYDWSED